jgi:hypothetical protein
VYLWVSHNYHNVQLAYRNQQKLTGICSGDCLLRGGNSVFKYLLHQLRVSRPCHGSGSRRPLTTEGRVQSQVSLCEICGRQSGIKTGFSPNTSSYAFPQYLPTMHRTHLHLKYYSHQKDKLSLGKIEKSNDVWETTVHWKEKSFSQCGSNTVFIWLYSY